jgi:hypothetical protein
VHGRLDAYRFKNGVFETDNPRIAEELKQLGFEYSDGEIKDDDSAGKKHSIPKNWTTERIKQYAEENGIVIPDDVLLKKDIIKLIENS